MAVRGVTRWNSTSKLWAERLLSAKTLGFCRAEGVTMSNFGLAEQIESAAF
jgi:hypothetical protein